MKKILRLVTTSVLTLTLVACGEATQCPTCETCEKCETCPTCPTLPTEGYADVSVIAISADTSSLTQVVGATKSVAVTAKFDGKADPATALEWYVNDVKQSQTGKTFEYTPGEAGSYKIVAKAGSVSSNELVVTVGAVASLEAAEPVVIDANSIQVKAEAGASVELSVAGTALTLKDESYYSISDGVYYLELAKDLKQGDEVKVVLKKDGKEVSKTVVYDTRKLTVEVTLNGTEVTPEDDGSYEVEKPHYTDLTNEGAVTYALTFAHEGLELATLQTVAFTATAPEGATAATSTSANSVVTATTTWGKTFTVNKDTVPGTYTFKYAVGDKEKEVKFVVTEPEKEAGLYAKANYYYASSADATVLKKTYAKIALGTVTVSDHAATVFSTNVENKYGVNGVYKASLADVAGKNTVDLYYATETSEDYFTIEKPYFDAAIPNTAFSFMVDVDNLDIPAALNKTGNTSTPNMVIVSVKAPDGTAQMRIKTGEKQNALQTLKLREAATETYVQRYDSTTPAGEYVYTISVLESGTEVFNKTFTVNLVEPTAKLTLTPSNLLDASGDVGQALVQDEVNTDLYVITKPSSTSKDAQAITFSATLKNYDSPKANQNGVASDPEKVFSNDKTTPANGTKKEFLTYKKSVTGPQEVKGQDADKLIAVELGANAYVNSYKGEWDATEAYKKAVTSGGNPSPADIVYYGGLYYEAKNDVSASSDGTNADPITATTSVWALCETFDANDQVNNASGIPAGNIIFHKGVAYRTLVALADDEKFDDIADGLTAAQAVNYKISGANYKGTWSQATKYSENDIVLYNGLLYKTNAGKDAYKGAYSTSKTYAEGETVYFNGKYYTVKDNNNGTPNEKLAPQYTAYSVTNSAAESETYKVLFEGKYYAEKTDKSDTNVELTSGYKGAYDALTTTYAANDIVKFTDGKYYIAKGAIPAGTAFAKYDATVDDYATWELYTSANAAIGTILEKETDATSLYYGMYKVMAGKSIVAGTSFYLDGVRYVSGSSGIAAGAYLSTATVEGTTLVANYAPYSLAKETAVWELYTSDETGFVIGTDFYKDGIRYVSKATATGTAVASFIETASNYEEFNASTYFKDIGDEGKWTEQSPYSTTTPSGYKEPKAPNADTTTWALLDSASEGKYTVSAARDIFCHEGVAYRALNEITSKTFKELKLGTDYVAADAKIVELDSFYQGQDLIKNTYTADDKTETAKAYYKSATNSITLNDVFDFAVDYNTKAGDYNFTLTIGELTKTVTIRVKEAESKVNFGLAENAFGEYSGGAAYKESEDLYDAAGLDKTGLYQNADESYTVTCASNTAGACGISAAVELSIDHFTPGLLGDAYTLTEVTPLNSKTTTGVTFLSDTGTNDGHATGSVIDSIKIANAGDYEYTLTIAGETKKIVIHALPAAESGLKALSVYNGTDKLVELTDREGHKAYVYSAKEGTTLALTINVETEGLPEGEKIYYSFDGSVMTELKDGKISYSLLAGEERKDKTATVTLYHYVGLAPKAIVGEDGEDAELTLQFFNYDFTKNS